MKLSPSREDNKFLASQKLPHILWNLTVHHPIHKRPPPVPIPGKRNSVHVSPPHSLKILLILSSHLRSDLTRGLFPPTGLLTKTFYALLLSPYVPHSLPISLFLILLH